MTTFDQRGQSVNYQYNAGGNINFSTVHNKLDAVNALKQLDKEIRVAIQQGAVSPKIGKEIQDKLELVTESVATPTPDKKTIISNLDEIRTIIKDVVSLGGLVTTVVQAIEMIHRLF